MTTTQQNPDADFLQQADPFRRELLAHCYRMLGSVHEAEDLVQETYLRAWRSYGQFEGRSSLRTWLHRIATRCCLTALEGQNRRPLPTGLGAPSSDPTADITEHDEVPWLEPIATDPATIVGERQNIRLALIAALQLLPARQRAVLILRDVLKWRAAEVAEALELSTAAVNSILQRARAQIADAAPTEETFQEPTGPAQREMLERYVTAFETYDMQAIVALFNDESVFQMPPYPGWYAGAENIGKLVATHCPAEQAGDLKFVAVEANGQPAFAQYKLVDGKYERFGMHVLTLAEGAVSNVTVFFDNSLLDQFDLPVTIPKT